MIYKFICIILQFSTGLYLTVKKVPVNSENLNTSEEEQFILTLEHKAMNNSLFLLRNKEFCPLGEENKIVNSDAFFGLIHLESGRG